MPSQEIYISEKEQEIWNRVRDLAIASGLSISALVTRTMAAYLEEHETPAIRAAWLRTKAAELEAEATHRAAQLRTKAAELEAEADALEAEAE